MAQGAEAGGHRSNFTVPPDGVVPMIGTLALVPQVVDAVDVPVIATGGIMDGRGLAAALALGAQAVQMGTRFLVTAESGVSEGYRQRIIRSRDTDAVVTRAVSGRPARGLSNRLITALEEAGPPGLGYPRQGAASADLRAAAARADLPELMALWAGQAGGLASDAPPAERLVEEIVQQARGVLRRAGRGPLRPGATTATGGGLPPEGPRRSRVPSPARQLGCGLVRPVGLGGRRGDLGERDQDEGDPAEDARGGREEPAEQAARRPPGS